MQGTAPQGTDVPAGRHRTVRRRRWGLSILLLLVLLIAAGGVAAARYYDWCRGASGPREPVTFEVERGTSGSEIVDSLHDRGVLRCALVSRWELRRRSLEDELRSGSFELTTNMKLDQVLVVLTTPPEQEQLPPGEGDGNNGNGNGNGNGTGTGVGGGISPDGANLGGGE